MKSAEPYLHHILDETGFLSRLVAAHGVDAIELDEVLERAVVRSFEVIGEAARNVPEEFRAKYPYIPWRKIVSLRNRLIHEYFAVDYAILKGILSTELPELQTSVARALDELGAKQDGSK